MNNDRTDKIIDQALSEYSSAEPLAGLEERVLQRLRMQPEPSFLALRKWGLPWACAAVLVLVGWLGWLAHDRQSVSTQHTAVIATSQGASTTTQQSASRPVASSPLTSEPPISASRTASVKSRRPVAASRSEVPRQVASERSPDLQHFTQYPQQPAPLTTQEQALVALAQAHPDALGTMTQAGQRITIAPIAVEPLASQANTEGDN